MTEYLREPCKSCPYRVDVPVGFWHRSEFQNLLAHDANPYLGAVFNCHQDRLLPERRRRYCVGWLLDQRRRGLPSIQLRLSLRDNDDAPALEELTDGGHELYGSIEELCAANGVGLEEARKR